MASVKHETLHFRAAVPYLQRLMSFTLATDRPLLAILPDQARSTVVGRHRARFLHAMTTADILKAAPGTAGFALMATANGRHVGQVRYEIEAEKIELIGRTGSLAAVLEALKKHRVADDVRWSDPVPDGMLAVYGERAATLVEAALGVALGEAAFADALWDGATVRITRIAAVASELGRAALHLRLPLALAPSLRVRLLAAGGEPLDVVDWERLRIEAGWPLDGLDLGAEDVALASERLAATVSWNKGCFLGQEVYVMARDRGELPKRLRGVVVPTGLVPVVHSEILQAEPAAVAPAVAAVPAVAFTPKVQGVMGSAAAVAAGGYVALAMLKRKASEPGTELALPDGRRVRVVALPR